MFLLDKLVAAPFYGIYKIVEEIYAAAQQEQQQEIDNTMQELILLYRSLESGSISEAEFEQREHLLLDKLDELKQN